MISVLTSSAFLSQVGQRQAADAGGGGQRHHWGAPHDQVADRQDHGASEAGPGRYKRGRGHGGANELGPQQTKVRGPHPVPEDTSGGVQQDHAGLQSASSDWGKGDVLCHQTLDVTREVVWCKGAD